MGGNTSYSRKWTIVYAALNLSFNFAQVAAFSNLEFRGHESVLKSSMVPIQRPCSCVTVSDRKIIRWSSCSRRPSWTTTSSQSLLFSKSPSFGSFEERLSDGKDLKTTVPFDSDSLSDLLSSPERYAFSLNMTLEEVEQKKKIYENASRSLQERLKRLDSEGGLSPSKVGKQKHEMICEHRLEYGRHPFVCSKCWSYLPVCVCHLASACQEKPSWKYPNLQVLVWTHHREWGLTSNTGSILALTLGNGDGTPNLDEGQEFVDPGTEGKSPCRLLMKGLPKHDQMLKNILDAASEKNTSEMDHSLVVVLWPSSNPENTVSLSELRDELEGTMGPTTTNGLGEVNTGAVGRGKQVVLLAVDGTWRNARRMVAKLPPHVKRLDLDEDALRWSDSQMNSKVKEDDLVSILSPLRKRGPSGKENQKLANEDLPQNEKRQVCTAEAVVAALHELRAIDTALAQHVLVVTQTKVDRVRRYRRKVQGSE